MKRLAFVGCGAIAQAAMRIVREDPAIDVAQVVVPEAGLSDARAFCAEWAPGARVRSGLDVGSATDARPELVVECAGHGALEEHVMPALRSGIPAVVVSIGALHDAGVLAALGDAAEHGGARVMLVSGAVGGIDALAAARIGGLSEVMYIGRKPPSAWLGTPAEGVCDLRTLAEPRAVFEGSAREAARLFPKNANVAATVSLAGLGFDATRATLVADPGVSRNVHRIVAAGAFGRMDITLENEALAANPKTSALTVYSVVRAIHQFTRAVSL